MESERERGEGGRERGRERDPERILKLSVL
jgi:hypothetical protein